MFEVNTIRDFSDNYIWTLVKDNEVTFDDFGTIADYVFIIGDKKDIPLEVNE